MLKKGTHDSIVRELNKLPWKRIFIDYCADNEPVYVKDGVSHKLTKKKLRELVSHGVFMYCSDFINNRRVLRNTYMVNLSINIKWSPVNGFNVKIEYLRSTLDEPIINIVRRNNKNFEYRNSHMTNLTNTRLKKRRG